MSLPIFLPCGLTQISLSTMMRCCRLGPRSLAVQLRCSSPSWVYIRVLIALSLLRGCTFNLNAFNRREKDRGRSQLSRPPCTLFFLQPMGASSTSAVSGMKTQGHIPALPKMKWVWMKIFPPSSLKTQLERPVSPLLPLSSLLS